MTIRRGRLRLYLGMAPGVGKTVAMLEEGQRRRARGEDIVAGFVETYGRPGTEAVLAGLEIVPRVRIEHRGIVVEEMDTAAVRRRAPSVVLIDELAHTNVPGSPHEKRWQDVEEIRDAGIDVISTCNVQHVASVADGVETLVGAPVRERVPDEVLRAADEIELVDLSPARLRRRMARGEVYPSDRAAVALDSFFTEPNLVALRDLALHLMTGHVDADLAGRLSADRPASTPAAALVLAVIDDAAPSGHVLDRASALAGRLRAKLVVLIVGSSRAGASARPGDDVDELAADATRRGADVVRALTDDPATTIAQAALERSATHVVLGQPSRGRLRRLVADPLPERILALAPDLEISLVGPGRAAPEGRQPTF